MSPEDQRRALLDLAYQLDGGSDLADSQRQFLALALYRIATGEDANKVLSVRPTRGQKLTDAVDKRRMSLILHWVACAMRPDPKTGEKAMTLVEACEAAMDAIVPHAKVVFPGADERKYEPEYIQRCWSDPVYAHMRSTERGWFDPDFPYFKLPDVKDPK
jgi:hypothetical protein